MEVKHTTVNTHDGPVFVGSLSDTVSLSVNLDYAHVQVFLTPGETTHLIAALQDALKVVEGGQS